MTDVVIGRPASTLGPDDGYIPSVRNSMTIGVEGTEVSITVPYSPREGDFSGLENAWTQTPRDGVREPLLMQSAKSSPKMTFTLWFGSKDWNQRVDADLRLLQSIAQSSNRVTVAYSSWENGLWRITALSFTVMARNEASNEITQASVAIEFTRASDITINIGPVSGGVVPTSPSTPKSTPTASHPRTYKWKKNDTLTKVAIRFYKDYRMWRKIATYNKIKHPSKIKVGRVIKLP